MSMTTSIEGPAPPEWVHLLPSGTFNGADGRGPWRAVDPAAIITASMTAPGRIPIDENHAIDLAAPKGGASPARGWIVEMQSRPNGIWGRVTWTHSGDALLRSGAYRWISPVMQHRPDGTVLRILRAALTNTPNLPQLTALNASTAPGRTLMSTDTPFKTNPLTPGTAGALGMNPDNHGEFRPTAAELEVGRKMGIDPNKLAQQRRAREGKALRDYDAGKIADFERAVTAPNDSLVANMARPSQGNVALAAEGERARPRATEHEIAKRMGLDPTKLAQHRTQRETAELANWDGPNNWGGHGDPSYQLTPTDQRMCATLGVDPQEFLAWKRDPISAPRPKGLPAQIGSNA